MVKLVNLMPHPFAYFEAASTPSTPPALLLTIPPSGTVARVQQIDEELERVTHCESGHTLRAMRSSFAREIVGLPDPAPNTLYIVSMVTRDAAKAQGRVDVVSPATGTSSTAVRDAAGTLIGTTALAF